MHNSSVPIWRRMLVKKALYHSQQLDAYSANLTADTTMAAPLRGACVAGQLHPHLLPLWHRRRLRRRQVSSSCSAMACMSASHRRYCRFYILLSFASALVPTPVCSRRAALATAIGPALSPLPRDADHVLRWRWTGPGVECLQCHEMEGRIKEPRVTLARGSMPASVMPRSDLEGGLSKKGAASLLIAAAL